MSDCSEPTRLAVLEKEMYEHLKDRMGVFRSEPYFLELVPKGIDKAQSLAVLLKRNRYDKRRNDCRW